MPRASGPPPQESSSSQPCLKKWLRDRRLVFGTVAILATLAVMFGILFLYDRYGKATAEPVSININDRLADADDTRVNNEQLSIPEELEKTTEQEQQVAGGLVAPQLLGESQKPIVLPSTTSRSADEARSSTESTKVVPVASSTSSASSVAKSTDSGTLLSSTPGTNGGHATSVSYITSNSSNQLTTHMPLSTAPQTDEQTSFSPKDASLNTVITHHSAISSGPARDVSTKANAEGAATTSSPVVSNSGDVGPTSPGSSVQSNNFPDTAMEDKLPNDSTTFSTPSYAFPDASSFYTSSTLNTVKYTGTVASFHNSGSTTRQWTLQDAVVFSDVPAGTICPAPARPERGTWVSPILADCARLQAGEACVLQCNVGYIPKDVSALAQCREDGRMIVSGEPECEPVMCSPPTYPNSTWITADGSTCTSVPVGTSCYLSCDSGFGISTVTFLCTNEGYGKVESQSSVWCKILAECKPPPLENGYWRKENTSSGDCTSMTTGDRCVARCHVHFQSQGQQGASISCQSDGLYTTPTITCKRRSCLTPRTVSGRLLPLGDSVCSDHMITVGSICFKSCDGGFDLDTSNIDRISVSCTERGLSTLPLAPCNPDCDIKPPLAMRVWTGCSSFVQDTYPGLPCKFLTCSDGYVSEDIRNTFVCHPTGFSPPLQEAICYNRISNNFVKRACTVLLAAPEENQVVAFEDRLYNKYYSPWNDQMDTKHLLFGLAYSRISFELFWVDRLDKNRNTVPQYIKVKRFSGNSQTEIHYASRDAPLTYLALDEYRNFVFVSVKGKGVLKTVRKLPGLHRWVVKDENPMHYRHGLAVDSERGILYSSVSDHSQNSRRSYIERVFYLEEPPRYDVIVSHPNGQPRGLVTFDYTEESLKPSVPSLMWLTDKGAIRVLKHPYNANTSSTIIDVHTPTLSYNPPTHGYWDTVGLTTACDGYHFFIRRSGISYGGDAQVWRFKFWGTTLEYGKATFTTEYKWFSSITVIGP